jgi:hypothetical protein
MDLFWYALEHGVSPAEAAQVVGLEEAQVARVYADLERKARTTDPLRMRPVGYEENF